MALFTAISLFTGCEGIGLGLKRVIPEIRTLCYVEINAYACANLVAKIKEGSLDDAPLWSDITTFDGKLFAGAVDLIHGGYPCQGFSCAGDRKGEADPRFLWPWVLRTVVVVQPQYCFFENVEGHVSLGLSTVLSDLEEAGYECAWGLFSAEECGAPHRRKRVFILGKRKARQKRMGHSAGVKTDRPQPGRLLSGAPGTGEALGDTKSQRPGEAWELRLDESAQRTSRAGFEMADPIGISIPPGPERSGRETRSDVGGCGTESELANANNSTPARQREYRGYADGKPEADGPCNGGELANPCREGREGREGVGGDNAAKQSAIKRSGSLWPAGPGQPQHEWEPPRTTEPGLGRSANGLSSRVDRLQLLGNAVVPDTAELAWRTLFARLTNKTLLT